MALNNLGLGFIFTAKDMATPVIRRMTGNMKMLDAQTAASGKAMAFLGSAKTVGGIAALAGGLTSVGLGFSMANAAGNFQQQLVATQQIMGATNDELGRMKEKIIAVGLKTKFSPDEIVEGMKNMGAMGLKASEAIDSIHPAALLATAGQIGLDDASRAVVGTIRSFGLATSEATTVADKLTKATQLSNLQAPDFANGFSKAAAVMGAYGQTVDDTLVGMGLLRNMNIDASSSGTAMREAIRRLGSDQTVVNKVTKAGVDIYDKKSGEMRGFGDILLDMIDKTKDWTVAQKNELSASVFGARGLLSYAAVSKATFRTVRNGQEVLLHGREAFEAMREEIKNSTGAAEAFNEALLNTFEGQKSILEGAWQTFKVLMGEGFATLLKPIVKGLADTVTAMANFIKNITPEQKELMAKLVMIGGVILTVLGAVTLLGAKFVLVAGLIGGAIYGVYKLIQHNVGGIGDIFRKTVGKVWLYMKGLMQLITDGFLSGDTLAQLVDKENAGVLRTLKTTVQIGYRIKKFFVGIGEGFVAAFRLSKDVLDAFFDSLSELGAEFGITSEGVGGLTSASKTWAESGKEVGHVLGEIALLLVRAVTGVVKLITWTVRAGKWIVENWNRIKAAVQGVIVAYGIYKGTVLLLAAAQKAWLAIQAIVYAAQVAFATATWAVSAAMSGELLAIGRAVAARALLAAKTALATVAQGGLTAATSGLSAALGPAGFVAAAFAAGYAIGTLIDKYTGASDAVADWLANLTGLNDQLEREAGVPVTDKRGGATFLGPDGKPLTPEQHQAAVEAGRRKGGVGGGLSPVAPPATGPQPTGTTDPVAAAAAELAAAEKEYMKAMKNPQVSAKVDVYLGEEKIAEAIAKGQKVAAAREFGG